jgi:plastocyanin
MKVWKKCVYTASVLGMFVTVDRAFARPTGGRGNAAQPKVEIKIDNFAFSPQELTVATGSTVEWVNRDDIPHAVLSNDKKTFKSKALDTDEKFSYTFTEPGTYTYFCSVHPKMTGKAIVQ